MKFVEKIYYGTLVYLLSFSSTLAQDGLRSGALGNPLGSKNLNEFFQGIILVCIQLGTVISALAIMYGGYLFVTAQGDEEKIGKARTTITWALVGTAVLLGARVIMAAIKGTIEQLQ